MQWCNLISYFVVYDYSSIYESLVDCCVNECARVFSKSSARYISADCRVAVFAEASVLWQSSSKFFGRHFRCARLIVVSRPTCGCCRGGRLIVKLFPSVTQDCLELEKPVVVADGLICAHFFRVAVDTRRILVCKLRYLFSKDADFVLPLF